MARKYRGARFAPLVLILAIIFIAVIFAVPMFGAADSGVNLTGTPLEKSYAGSQIITIGIMAWLLPIIVVILGLGVVFYVWRNARKSSLKRY